MMLALTSSSLARRSMLLFLHPRPASQQLRTLAGTVWLAGLDLLPEAVRCFLAGTEVTVYLLLVAEIIRDGGVDIGQLQRRVGLNNPLRLQAGLEVANHRVER